jgi:glycerophosphoryl diester phosphodiesterase
MSTIPKIWGHRGCRGPSNPPENSLAAFRSAIEQGADGVELDVFSTKDHRLVVFHDGTLERMTNGHGIITSFDFAELQNLRLRDPAGGMTTESIPSLDEVLDVVDQFRSQHPEEERARSFVVNVEIKDAAATSHLAYLLKGRLKKGWTTSNFRVSSFDMNSLGEMQRALADIAIGALFASANEPWDIEEAPLVEQLVAIQDLRLATVNITLPSLTLAASQIIRRTGAPVAWSWNEVNPAQLGPDERRQLAAQILSNQIDAIITDFPEPMRRLLEEHR